MTDCACRTISTVDGGLQSSSSPVPTSMSHVVAVTGVRPQHTSRQATSIAATTDGATAVGRRQRCRWDTVGVGGAPSMIPDAMWCVAKRLSVQRVCLHVWRVAPVLQREAELYSDNDRAEIQRNALSLSTAHVTLSGAALAAAAAAARYSIAAPQFVSWWLIAAIWLGFIAACVRLCWKSPRHIDGFAGCYHGRYTAQTSDRLLSLNGAAAHSHFISFSRTCWVIVFVQCAIVLHAETWAVHTHVDMILQLLLLDIVQKWTEIYCLDTHNTSVWGDVSVFPLKTIFSIIVVYN